MKLSILNCLRLLLADITAAILLGHLVSGKENETSEPPSVTYTNVLEALEDRTNESTALARFAFETAAARHTEDVRSDKKYIYTTHHGQTIRLYKSPSYLLVSLPYSTPMERAANAVFCCHYNE